VRRSVILLSCALCASALGVLTVSACGSVAMTSTSPSATPSPVHAGQSGKPGPTLAVGQGQDFTGADGHIVNISIGAVVDPATSAQQSRPGASRRLIDVPCTVTIVNTSGKTGLAEEHHAVRFNGPSSFVLRCADGPDHTPWLHSAQIPLWIGFTAPEGGGVVGQVTFAVAKSAVPSALTVRMPLGTEPRSASWNLTRNQ
jgi:hypothetical protein